MAVKADTTKILEVAMASEAAAADLIANLGGGAGLSGTDLTASGNATIGGTLGVTGATTLSTVHATGNATIGGTCAVTGNATLSGTCAVTGAATIGGTCALSGDALLASGKVLKVNSVQVVGAQAAVIAPATITVGTGALPTPDGTTVVADPATPTAVELLDAIVELKTKHDAVVTALKAHGLIASA